MPVQRKAFFLLLAVITVAFGWLLLPYYSAVLWAVILAIIFQPMHRALENRLPRRANVAALLSVLVCILLAIIPVAVLMTSLVQEGVTVVQKVHDRNIDFGEYFTRFQAAIPESIKGWMNDAGVDLGIVREKLSSAAMQASQLVAGRALSIGQNTLQFVVSFGIMLYLLFFLFRDGRRISRAIRASMPLSHEYTNQLLGKFAAVVRATVKGNVIIAVVQGVIGGVTFWLIGIEGALLWGVLMAFLSLLPAIGAAVVWAPVALYLLVTGSYIKGIILIFVGVAVIGLVDNLLRPPLVGKETKLPDYVVLISTVGGMSLLGINGFVIGPLIAALFIAAWTLFRTEQETSVLQGHEPGDTRLILPKD
nr:AI-2E family transporter [Faunimonas pinastri]